MNGLSLIISIISFIKKQRSTNDWIKSKDEVNGKWSQNLWQTKWKEKVGLKKEKKIRQSNYHN